METSRNDPDAMDLETPFLDTEFESKLDSARASEQRIESPFLEAELIANSRNDDEESVIAWEDLSDEEKQQIYEGEFDEAVEEEAFAELWTEETEEPEGDGEQCNESEAGDSFEGDEEALIAELHSDEERDSGVEEVEGLRDEDDYLMEEAENEELFSTKESEASENFEKEIKVSNTPQPGQFYRIQKGDNLLDIVGKAYGVGAGKRRLAFAQYVNAHSFNRKYFIKGKSDFVEKHFPDGVISFYPTFDCDAEELIKAESVPPKGKCFAVILFPPKRYSYHSYLGKGKIIPQQEMPSQDLEGLVSPPPPSPVQPKRGPLAKVEDTKASVFRWVCHLRFTFEDPDGDDDMVFDQNGSGVLIGPQHVLTAAHLTFAWITGSKTGMPQRVAPKEVRVIPGYDGVNSPWGKFHAAHRGGNKTIDQILPSGWMPPPDTSTVPKDKIQILHALHDYAVFKLSSPSGPTKLGDETLGWWGSSGGTSVGFDGIRRNAEVRHCGYPDSKVGQFWSWGRAYEIYKQHVLWHDVPSDFGMSGGPFWLEEDSTPGPQLIAVSSRKAGTDTDPNSHNLAVLLTPNVLKFVEEAKRLLDR